MKNNITYNELVIKYEMENSGLFELLNSKCPRGLKPIETWEKFNKILRTDRWVDGNIINDIYGLENHANWKLVGDEYMFIPNKCNIMNYRKKNYGYCDLCNCNNRSQEVFQFENADKEYIDRYKERLDKFNGYYDYGGYPEYYKGKQICMNCLETTFQDAIVTRFNLVRRRINK